MIDIRRASSRFRSEHDGITSWHSFSAGAYFDPDNVAFGRLVGCDEHLLAPGAGFAAHRHARVEILSWVLSGTLRHQGQGESRLIGAGAAQVQRAGAGIEHREGNASAGEPLRFVQFTLLADADESTYRTGEPPVTLEAGGFMVLTRCRGAIVTAPLAHLYVAQGNFHVSGTDLVAGDCVRVDERVAVDGDGELLVLALTW